MTIKIESLFKNPDDIPMLPASVTKIMEAIYNPNSRYEDIATLISRDVSLTTKILKSVNSAYFGFSSKISSIPYSINIIGLNPIGSLILASTLLSKFKGMPEDFVTMESFWSHSIASGIAAKEICQLKGLKHKEETLYVAGLMHDIGCMIIYKEFPEKAGIALNQCNEEGEDIIIAERKALGFDHAEVGAALIKRWKLPELIQETTEFHHKPLSAPVYKEEAAIVHVAEYIVQSNQLGSSGEIQSTDLDPRILKSLKLSTDDLGPISEKTIERFDDIYDALNT